jgi:S-adenosylmethionine:tRNA ribosyltransferase-isomerase
MIIFAAFGKSGMDNLNLSDYTYQLPDDRIAKHPLSERDNSKLLVYDKGSIEHKQFKDITGLIPADSTLFFNNTKVIPARIYLNKDTGALIEIFLLNPIAPSNIMSIVMEERRSVIWTCMIGNYKKWKGDSLNTTLDINGIQVTLSATIIDRDKRDIQFEWDNADISFAEIVESAGQVPLPPYLNRAPEANDKPRYQTIYSQHDGAVAAPTAGLHFTKIVLQELRLKNIHQDFLTLHVSAGTFQPIKTENVLEHPMHSEQIVATKENIQNIIKATGKIIPVGTTSMRSLESLYWFGARLINGIEDFSIQKLEPYQSNSTPSRNLAFQAILEWMNKNSLTHIVGKTEIFIVPGYQFRACDGLITNFHQPGSTLMLLVAALIGEDWKKVYQEAISNDYRFLSYGDSSLLLPSS